LNISIYYMIKYIYIIIIYIMGNICNLDHNDNSLFCIKCGKNWNSKFFPHCTICCTTCNYSDFHCCDCKYIETIGKNERQPFFIINCYNKKS
jgi:hypothetical protein